MRPALLTLALILSPLAAPASSGDAWDEFRRSVKTACTALVKEPGKITVKVDPFGSESYGAALVTLRAKAGTTKYICIYDKVTKKAELTSGLPDQ